MGAMACQIISLTIVYSTVYQAQIKEHIKAPRHWPVNSPHKWPAWVTRKMFPFHDVIMINLYLLKPLSEYERMKYDTYVCFDGMHTMGNSHDWSYIFHMSMTTPVSIGSILYQSQGFLDLFERDVLAVYISTTILYHQTEVDGYLMKQRDGNMILNSEPLFTEKTSS